MDEVVSQASVAESTLPSPIVSMVHTAVVPSLVPTPVPSLVPTPVPSRVPTPVPTLTYSPYTTPPGSISPATSARSSPVPHSPIIPPIDQIRSSLHDSTSARPPSQVSTSSRSSSSQVASDHHTAPQSFGIRDPNISTRRRHYHSQDYRSTVVYNPGDSRRQASMNLAADNGRPVGYGITRDAKMVCMQANGNVKVGKEPITDCCVIL